MKIWQVTVYDNAYAFYFKPTKKEADAYAKELRQQYADADDEATIEVEPFELSPTREGIAHALQGFVDYTCMNEH
jgi:hypothetical protein